MKLYIDERNNMMKKVMFIFVIGLIMVSCNKVEEKQNDDNNSFIYEVTRAEESGKISWDISIKREKDDFSQNIIMNKDEDVALLPSEDNMVEIRDVNFDGYEDVMIHKGNYGAQGTKIYEAYIWDEQSKKLVRKESFNLIPNPEIDYDNEVVLGENRENSSTHDYFVYKYENSKYVKTDMMTVIIKEDGNMFITEKKLVNGEWKEVFSSSVSQEEYEERYEQMISH